MGSEEAEILGKAVLTNQFISGLHPEQKSMLAGQEASFDQLLGRTHFEEATQQDFQQKVTGDLAPGVVMKAVNGVVKSGTPPRLPTGSQDRGQLRDQSPRSAPPRSSQGCISSVAPRETDQIWCYTCGAVGLVHKNCRLWTTQLAPRNPEENHRGRARLGP